MSNNKSPSLLYLLLCAIFIANITRADVLPDIEVFTNDSMDEKYLVYSKGILYPEWNTILLARSATQSPDIVVEPSSQDARNFTISNNSTSTISLQKLNVMSQNSIILKPDTQGESDIPYFIPPGQTYTILLTYNCDNENIINKDLDGWTYLEVTLKIDGKALTFDYMKICTMKNRQGADYSTYIVLILAIVVVATQTRQKKTLLGDQGQHMDEIQPIHAIFFVVFASISLMVLYFFSEYIKNVITVIFIFYALTGCSVIFAQWTEDYIASNAFWSRHYQIKYIGAVNLHAIACFSVALAVVLSWFFTRAWILNNIIGLSIVCLIFRVVKLPSLKIAYMLLGMCFFYDIFWVFISTPIFGRSVMMVAATALDLPIKIEWPYLGATPLPRCAMLGLGDMVLPGFFVTFNYRFGLYKKTNAYYYSSIISYAIGIILCGAVLILTKTGQPALLYIVPSMLGFATYVSKRRGEFEQMWEGIPDSQQYKNIDDKKALQLSTPEEHEL